MPRYGFNFLWICDADRRPEPQPANVRELDLVAELGLDFVRVPADYRYWTVGTDYASPDHKMLHRIDAYLDACRSRGLHMCLNLHRAPGYCINRPEIEKHNLWTDAAAQDGFVHQWELFARMYKGVPSSSLSFDLVNEPPAEGSRGFTRKRHEKVIRRTVAAIRSIDPDREIVIDGIAGGNLAMPELADVGAVHSGRGYQPYCLSHYKAPWSKGAMELPEPVWPGLEYKGHVWDREALSKFYRPWRELQTRGVRVHVGEFGCFKETPNDVALRWFADLLSLFREYGWGYSLWNFKGPFGIIDHGRPGTKYEQWCGQKLDRRLLELFLENRSHEKTPRRGRSRLEDTAVIKRSEARSAGWTDD